ncbi:MAG TPA: hypothetical protein VK858_14405 [Longimicrobiales bacterium]|nr:hypothetical protein [Longimicrobiales bacterium]
MPPQPRRRSRSRWWDRARALATFCLALPLASCTSWASTSIDLRTLVEGERPDRIRITDARGAREVTYPRVAGDSLFTVPSRCQHLALEAEPRCMESARAVVGLADVHVVEVRDRDQLKTALLTPAILLGVIGGAALVACAGGDSFVC